MGDFFIECKGIMKSFYGVTALNCMNFTIHPGEIRCLIGENGSGKSTLIKVIAGYYACDGGQIYIDGKERKDLTPIESIESGIQVIYQDFSLFPNMTVAENIMMCSNVNNRIKIIHRGKILEGARRTLEKIGFHVDLNAIVSDLNVAQKQMVAICRAIVQDVKLIIMDEPTTALTYKEVRNLFEVVKELKKKGIAVLFVSHKLDEVLEISEQITVIRNGCNVCDGPTNTFTKADLIYHMTGKYLELKTNTYKSTDAEVLMQIKDYSQGGFFQNINFTLHKGEILGITGLLGCGKNELANALFGVLPADSGSVFVSGRDCGVLRTVYQAITCKIAYVPEDRLTQGLHLDQGIGDNSIASVIGSFVNKFGLLDKNKMNQQKQKVLSNFNIDQSKFENPVRSLSGGNQQKVVLAKWLAVNPSILVLNGPTVGVDIGAKSEIYEIVKLLAEGGIGVIVISDDILEIVQLCSRVLVMQDGKIAAEVNTCDTSMEKLEQMILEKDKMPMGAMQ